MHIATATMYTTHSAKHLQTKASKSHVCVSAVSLDFNIRSSFFSLSSLLYTTKRMGLVKRPKRGLSFSP